MLDKTAIRSAFVSFATLALFAGCLTPPCNCAEANSPASADVAASSNASAPAASTAAASPAPAGSVVLWDGDAEGLKAKGWVGCDKKPECKSVLEPAPGGGRNGSMGLRFQGTGSGWIGGGWNLLNWWPQDGGMDISGTTHMVLWVRVEAKNAEEGLDPNSLGVGLKCSGGDKCASNTTMLAKYTKDNLLDGQWHEVAVPLTDLKKPEFNPAKTWELIFTSWSSTPKNFTVFFDDISCQKR